MTLAVYLVKRPHEEGKMSKCHLLHLPLELHLDIIDLDPTFAKWPLLSKYTATTTRFDSDLNKHGKWMKHKNVLGSKKSMLLGQERWRHGQLHGEYKSWYGVHHKHIQDVLHKEQTQMSCHCYYSNGKKEGEYKEWHQNGELRRHCYYVDGKLEGESKQWYNSGQIYEDSNFVCDELVGSYKQWNNHGLCTVDGSYVDGTLVRSRKR